MKTCQNCRKEIKQGEESQRNKKGIYSHVNCPKEQEVWGKTKGG